MSELQLSLVEEVRKSLAENHFKDILSIINDNKHGVDLKNNCWDLIPLIVENLNHDTEISNEEKFICCKQLLQNIIDKSNPEEVLLEMIEQIENAKDDTAFITLINCTSIALLRLPEKRQHSLAWVLSAIQRYMNKIPLPENHNFSDEKDSILLDADPIVDRISSLYKEVVPFYKMLVEELLNDSACANRAKRVEILQGFLVKLLGNPLASLDLECNHLAKSRGRRCAEVLIGLVVSITKDPYTFLEFDPQAETNEVEIPLTAFGVFYYLLLSEHVCIDLAPNIYSPIYVMQHCLRLCADLMKQNEYLAVKKGLLLGHALLYGFAKGEVPFSVLDSVDHCNFCMALSNVIVYNPVEDFRKLGIKLFNLYLFKFDWKGRHYCVYNLLNALTHSGIVGYVITQYKDMLCELFQKNDNNFSEHFSGAKLYSVLDVCCKLQHGTQTDILDDSDRISAALNLLRFLAIRDRRHNLTGIWDYWGALDESFVKPLREGVLLSEAHYEARIKELKNDGSGEKCKDTTKDDVEFSVNVGGEKLGEMSDAEKLKVLYSGINAFEVMKSLIARLKECIEEGLHEQKSC